MGTPEVDIEYQPGTRDALGHRAHHGSRRQGDRGATRRCAPLTSPPVRAMCPTGRGVTATTKGR
jgi:hypothetical protein